MMRPTRNGDLPVASRGRRGSDRSPPMTCTCAAWPTSGLGNSANIRFREGTGPNLALGARFYFETFGFPARLRSSSTSRLRTNGLDESLGTAG